MKATLKRQPSGLYHFRNNVRIEGPHTCLRGNVSGLRGNVSGLSGDVSYLSGDVDACEITDAERKAGVPIEKLIAGLEKEKL